jgi:ubiquinone/menaquinone biosynthesis C-methylase UbiE
VPQPPPRPDSPADAEAARLGASYARRAAAVHDSWSDPAYRFMRQERERRTLALLAREHSAPISSLRILDAGCGTGNWLMDLVRWGAAPENVHGVELLSDRVATARRSAAPGVTVTQGDISTLAYPDASFDLVIQSTVFSSILDEERRRRTAGEMRRVVRLGGIILWYDFHMDNPRNPDVRGVRQTDIRDLFPGCAIRMERITLAPPIARAVAPFSTLACELLLLLPFLRTHTLAAIRPA